MHIITFSLTTRAASYNISHENAGDANRVVTITIVPDHVAPHAILTHSVLLSDSIRCHDLLSYTVFVLTVMSHAKMTQRSFGNITRSHRSCCHIIHDNRLCCTCHTVIWSCCLIYRCHMDIVLAHSSLSQIVPFHTTLALIMLSVTYHAVTDPVVIGRVATHNVGRNRVVT